MVRKRPQVLGGDLNRSESGRPPAYPRLPAAIPSRTPPLRPRASARNDGARGRPAMRREAAVVASVVSGAAASVDLAAERNDPFGLAMRDARGRPWNYSSPSSVVPGVSRAPS
jgi:hypothetical protein